MVGIQQHLESISVELKWLPMVVSPGDRNFPSARNWYLGRSVPQYSMSTSLTQTRLILLVKYQLNGHNGNNYVRKPINQ